MVYGRNLCGGFGPKGAQGPGRYMIQLFFLTIFLGFTGCLGDDVDTGAFESQGSYYRRKAAMLSL